MIDSGHVRAAPGSTEKTVDAVPRRRRSQTLVPEALREDVDRIAIIGRLTASVEGTMMKGLQTGAPEPSFAADQQFLLVANGLAELLETARRELERDQEMAKASLVTAGRILHSEIERYSGSNGCPRAGLAGWQLLRVRAHIDCNLQSHHSYPGSLCGRAPKPLALLSTIQTGCRRVATCLRSEKTSGKSLPPDDNQHDIIE
jgi:hypothetical protein